jgi:hypothetical protein
VGLNDERESKTYSLELSIKRGRETGLLPDESHGGEVDHVVDGGAEDELREVADTVGELLCDVSMSARRDF